ncbi:MAG TPA: universal stress protein [Actinomycetota bacterium]|nr:universal stress protein [Actinomycetota bacterium]
MIQKLLVGTDTSAAADLAVETAAALAGAREAELLVLYVRPPLDAREVFDPGKVPDPEAYLARMPSRFPAVKVRTRAEAGDPAETICQVADEEGVDVIVVGNRGTHGRRRWFLGSVPNAVVQHAPCSVFIVDTRRAQ